MLSRYARKMLMIVGSVYCLCAASVMVSMLLVGGANGTMQLLTTAGLQSVSVILRCWA